jgi:3-methyladenine DNA glycosylase Tag
MKGKIEELEEVRAEVEKLKINKDGFIEELMQLLNKTTGQLSKVDDQQEINWTSKSFDIATELKKKETNKNSEEQKDLALTYLKEALDSVIIREKRYLK